MNNKDKVARNLEIEEFCNLGGMIKNNNNSHMWLWRPG